MIKKSFFRVVVSFSCLVHLFLHRLNLDVELVRTLLLCVSVCSQFLCYGL
jgi:hypothetical protein